LDAIRIADAVVQRDAQRITDASAHERQSAAEGDGHGIDLPIADEGRRDIGEGEGGVRRSVPPAVPVRVEVPNAVLEDADALVREVTPGPDDRNVPLPTEVSNDVAGVPRPVAVPIE